MSYAVTSHLGFSASSDVKVVEVSILHDRLMTDRITPGVLEGATRDMENLMHAFRESDGSDREVLLDALGTLYAVIRQAVKA